MSKRARQSDDEEVFEQALKKQISSKNHEIKIREIKSLSSEKTMNILFKAASKKSSNSEVPLPLRCPCSNTNQGLSQCYFCDKMICSNCLRPCDICGDIFCESCSFLMYDDQYDCICYSCLNSR
ncbi:uncharacterized protein LOC123321409 [Coccinella septempunctata]|uniref:uncharacterized protein LOC123321409 n=1 Tax=Coccinella septempunctata TaxID=41139 RepID=UPI001D06422E|nr:uncharacterized protein LOC123321409 [Coccinella septempunctata]